MKNHVLVEKKVNDFRDSLLILLEIFHLYFNR